MPIMSSVNTNERHLVSIINHKRSAADTLAYGFDEAHTQFSEVLRTGLFNYFISFLIGHVTLSLLYMILFLTVVTFLLTLIWSIHRLDSFSSVSTLLNSITILTLRSSVEPSLTLDQSSPHRRFRCRRRLSG